MPPPLRVSVAGAAVDLLPEGAAFLPEARTLLVADAHFGKAASFRALGVPVPSGTTADTLDRLEAALGRVAAARVVFLGDFLHSARGRSAGTLAALAHWRARRAGLAMTLVRGNHDAHAGDPPPELGLEVVAEPLPLAPFLLCHHPEPHPGGYVLAGHLHPAVRLSGPARQRLTLPCFRFGAAVGVLPAFGSFTGRAVLPARPGERLYALAGEAVVPVQAAPPQPRRRLRA